jgi:hypothetical protein
MPSRCGEGQFYHFTFTLVPISLQTGTGLRPSAKQVHHVTRIRRYYWAKWIVTLTHRPALRTSLIALVILLLSGTLKQKDWNISASVQQRTIPKTDVFVHGYVLLLLEFDGPCPAQNWNREIVFCILRLFASPQVRLLSLILLLLSFKST